MAVFLPMMDGWIDGWMDGWHQWMAGWLSLRMDGRMDGRTDGWIYGWIGPARLETRRLNETILPSCRSTSNYSNSIGEKVNYSVHSWFSQGPSDGPAIGSYDLFPDSRPPNPAFKSISCNEIRIFLQPMDNFVPGKIFGKKNQTHTHTKHSNQIR